MTGRRIRTTLTGLAAGLALGTVAIVPQPAGAAGGAGPDPVLAPTMFVGDARIEEGHAGRHVAKIPVTLSAALPGNAHFTFQTIDDGKTGATPYEDYQPKNIRKKIAAGKTSTVVTVPILGDVEEEGPERVSFAITVLDAPAVAVVKSAGQVAIADDDSADAGAPTVAIGATRVHEGDTGKRTIPVSFTLPEAQATDVLVTWQTVSETAMAGSDFKGVTTKTSRIKAGRTHKADFLTLYGDTEVEDDEQLRVFITGISGGSGLEITTDLSSGLVLISDDDADTDGDGLVDGAEVHTKTDPASNDSDEDGLPDGDEVRRFFTNPNQIDTDGDDYDDLFEIKSGTNPLDPADHP